MATLNHRRPGSSSFGRGFLFCLLITAFLWQAGLFSTQLQAQTEKQLVSKVFSYGSMPQPEAEATVKGLLTKDGKYVFIPQKQTVMVQDIAERVDMIGAVLADMSKPQPNVRIEVSFQETSSNQSGGVQVNSYPGGPNNRPGVRNYPTSIDGPNSYNGGGGIVIGGGSSVTTRTSNSGQFLVVQGGQSASIDVSKQVPFVDYFYNYANYLGFPVPAVRWESVGTRMSVRPDVQGNMIRVEVVPEITALSGGRYQTISIRQLATVVTVPNGVPVQIGGFQGAADEFNRNFFSGFGSSRGGSNSTFTLKATVQ